MTIINWGPLGEHKMGALPYAEGGFGWGRGVT